MKGEFVLRIDGELKTFTDYRDIPERFDHVIKFLPDLPPPPHNEQDHEEIQKWTVLLQNLVKKETHGR